MLTTLITGLVSGEAAESLGRMRKALVMYIIAGVLLLCGVTFLLLAAFIAAARRFGAIEAALGFGGAFVLIALLVLLIHRLSARSKAKKAAHRRQSEMAAVASAAAVAALPTLLSSSKGRSAALLAPALAALGWAIWRENTRTRRKMSRDGL